MRDLEKPGRSLVMARNGMAATSHPLATLTAVEVLRDGGNAMDAAVAACAVQGVVEPGSTGIGGDCFALVSPDGSDRIVAFNGAGRSPEAASAHWFASQGVQEIPRQSAHAVTVPGAVDAWRELALPLLGKGRALARHQANPPSRRMRSQPAAAFRGSGQATRAPPRK